MIYGMMAFVVTALLIIYNLLLNVTTADFLMPVVYGIQAIFAGVIIFGLIANLERFKGNERIQHYYFLIAKYFGYFMTPIFFKPINQITMTFFSGYKKGKSNIGLTAAFFAIAMSLSFTHIFKSNIGILIKKGEEASFFQKNKIYPEFYEDSHPEKKTIMNPVIPSQQINGSFLKIFIPVFDNEDFIQENFCGTFVEDEAKSWAENRRAKKEQMIFCYQKYHQVFVNDSLYQVEFLKEDHPHNLEFGIVGFLPTDRFLKGKNELRTVKLETPEGEIYDELTIPFWFSKR